MREYRGVGEVERAVGERSNSSGSNASYVAKAPSLLLPANNGANAKLQAKRRLLGAAELMAEARVCSLRKMGASQSRSVGRYRQDTQARISPKGSFWHL